MEQNDPYLILDSSVWIAYFNERDSQHTKAARIFEIIKKEWQTIVAPEYIIAEVATVLRARAGVGAAHTFLDIILHNKDIRVLFSHEQFFHAVGKAFRRVTKKDLSFVDIALLVLAREYTVVTFDHILQKELKKILGG